MKTKVRLGVAIIILFVSSVYAIFIYPSFFGSKPKAYEVFIKGPVGEEIVLNCTLPEVPSDVPKLKVVSVGITEDWAREVARSLFELTGNVTKPPLCEAYRIQNGSLDLWLAYSRGIWYLDMSKLNPRYTPVTLPTSPEAKVIAEHFMEKVKEYGLAPNNPRIKIEFDGVSPGSVTSLLGNEIICYLNVRFVIKFDNIPLMKGATISIGENGEVIQFFGRWREVEQEGMTKIITPKQALDRLPTVGYGKVAVMPKMVIIESVELNYFDDKDCFAQQDYLKLIYMFKGTLISDGGEKYTFFQMVPAN